MAAHKLFILVFLSIVKVCVLQFDSICVKILGTTETFRVSVKQTVNNLPDILKMDLIIAEETPNARRIHKSIQHYVEKTPLPCAGKSLLVPGVFPNANKFHMSIQLKYGLQEVVIDHAHAIITQGVVGMSSTMIGVEGLIKIDVTFSANFNEGVEQVVDMQQWSRILDDISNNQAICVKSLTNGIYLNNAINLRSSKIYPLFNHYIVTVTAYYDHDRTRIIDEAKVVVYLYVCNTLNNVVPTDIIVDPGTEILSFQFELADGTQYFTLDWFKDSSDLTYSPRENSNTFADVSVSSVVTSAVNDGSVVRVNLGYKKYAEVSCTAHDEASYLETSEINGETLVVRSYFADKTNQDPKMKKFLPGIPAEVAECLRSKQ